LKASYSKFAVIQRLRVEPGADIDNPEQLVSAASLNAEMLRESLLVITLIKEFNCETVAGASARVKKFQV
jgi:hypothetical protein